MSENESKSKCNITKAEFCPAEVLFPGQTDDITKFLRYYAVSVDIYYYYCPLADSNNLLLFSCRAPPEIHYHPSKSISRFFCRIFVNVTH